MFPDRPDPLMQTKMSQKWEEKTHFCQVFKPNIHSPGKGVLDKTPFRDQAFPANVRGPPSRGRTQSDPTREHKISLSPVSQHNLRSSQAELSYLLIYSLHLTLLSPLEKNWV